MSYISYSTMPTLRRLVKIATKFRYVCSRNYGFVVFFFFSGSEQKGGVRVASVLQRLVMRPPRDERNKKMYLRKGERGSSYYNITSVGTRIANKFGRSGVSNKLDIARERCTLNSGC